MYKKINALKVGFFPGVSVNPFCSDVRVHRPQSFYARGGVDLRGADPRKPMPSSPDDPDHPGELNLLTQPDLDKLDLLDYASSLDHEADMRAVEQNAGEHLENDE